MQSLPFGSLPPPPTTYITWFAFGFFFEFSFASPPYTNPPPGLEKQRYQRPGGKRYENEANKANTAYTAYIIDLT